MKKSAWLHIEVVEYKLVVYSELLIVEQRLTSFNKFKGWRAEGMMLPRASHNNWEPYFT